MKKLINIFIFVSMLFIPVLGRAGSGSCPSFNCGTDNCDIAAMLENPKEPCSLSMWRCRACISKMENHAANHPESWGRIKEVLSGFDSTGSLYNSLWDQVGDMRKKTGQLEISKEVCTAIYNSAKSSACPVDSMERESADSLNWFNPKCLEKVETYLSNNPDKRRPHLDWIALARDPIFRFTVCCMSEFKDMPNRGASACEIADNSFRNQQGSIIAVLEGRGYTYRRVNVTEAGAIRERVMSDEDDILRNGKPIDGGELQEVVVIGYRDQSAETKQAVEESFHYQPWTPPGKTPVPGQEDGSGGEGGEGDNGKELTQAECLARHNASHGVCEDLAPLLASGRDLAWLKPACLEELTQKLNNEQGLEEYKRRYGEELAVLGRLWSGEELLRNYEKCGNRWPVFADEDFADKKANYLAALSNRTEKFRERCTQLAARVAQRACPQEPSFLLNNPTAEDWEIPACIDEVTKSLRESVDINAFWSQTAGSEVMSGKIQKTLLLPLEYNACSHAFDFRWDVSPLSRATENLEAALREKGVNLGEILEDGETISVGEDNGKGNGKGNGKDNGKGNGKDNGKGNGKDNGKGNGKDNGKGNGKDNGKGNGKGDNDESSSITGGWWPWGKATQNWDASGWQLPGLGLFFSDEYNNAPVDIVTDED